MGLENRFTDKDKSQVIQFLNMVATKAEFKLSTQEVISYYKLLSFMQTELLPKIEANIFEIKKIHEDKSQES